MFSKACEHGIKAMIYITTQSLKGRRVKIGDVAENSGSPEAFTAKVLGALTHHNIVRSFKGPYGGFEVENPQQINVADIVSAIDGDAIFKGCALGLERCDALRPCPMHSKFVKVRNDLHKTLTETSILDLALDLKEGETVLIR